MLGGAFLRIRVYDQRSRKKRSYENNAYGSLSRCLQQFGFRAIWRIQRPRRQWQSYSQFRHEFWTDVRSHARQQYERAWEASAEDGAKYRHFEYRHFEYRYHEQCQAIT
jgi:hypothetical protein